MDKAGGIDEEIMRYRADVAERYLERARGMGMRVQSLGCAIEERYRSAAGVCAVDYARMPVGSAAGGDRIPDAVAAIDALTRELREQRDACEREVSAVVRALGRMEDASLAALLEMHYIANRPWAQCAKAFHYSRRSITSMRTRALSAFYDVMPAREVEEIPSAI